MSSSWADQYAPSYMSDRLDWKRQNAGDARAIIGCVQLCALSPIKLLCHDCSMIKEKKILFFCHRVSYEGETSSVSIISVLWCSRCKIHGYVAVPNRQARARAGVVVQDRKGRLCSTFLLCNDDRESFPVEVVYSLSCNQIPNPWIGDTVESGIGLSNQPASLRSRYDNPMPESTLYPPSMTMNNEFGCWVQK